MAYDLLTTSGIDGLVSSYKSAESNKRLTPLTNRKTYYQNIDSAYSTINSKLSSLSTDLTSLASTDSTSAFSTMKAVTSNTNFLSVTATNSALSNTSTMRVNQLAKSDLVLSQDLTSDAASTVITAAGSHDFVITSGDGAGGTLTSNVTVTFDAADFTLESNTKISNSKVMEKIQAAINSDKAVVNSNAVTGTTATTEGSFNLNLNGTETTINYSAGTYSEVLDSVVSQINALSGISAEKVAVGGTDYQLKITVTDSSKYISIGNDLTGTLVTDLNIASPATKEKGASGIVSASLFSPVSGSSQLSLTSKQSGYDYRIMSMSESGLNTALTSLGLNLGAARTPFVQDPLVDTAGYVYAETALNAKMEYNGINVERNSNSISDLIPGSTITLNSVMQGTDATVNVSVSKDTAAVKTKINDFISKFNDVYVYLKSNLTSTKDGRGILLGDSTATSLHSLFSSVAISPVSGIPSDQINTLSKLGISFDATSGLSITDSSVLDSALNDKPDQVAALFNSTNGIAKTLSDRIAPYLGSLGYITTRKNSFLSNITSINDAGTATQAKIDKSAEALRGRYLKMQAELQQVLNLRTSFSSYYSSSSSSAG